MIPALYVPYGHVRKSNINMSTELLIHIRHEQYHSWQNPCLSPDCIQSRDYRITHVTYSRDYRNGHS